MLIQEFGILKMTVLCHTQRSMEEKKKNENPFERVSTAEIETSHIRQQMQRSHNIL